MTNQYIIEIRKNIYASIEFISKVIDNCPDELWVTENKSKISISKRILHILESLDYRVGCSISYIYGKNKRPEIQDSELVEFTKNIAIDYFHKVETKVKQYLDELTEEELLKDNLNTKGTSNLAVLLSQIRHINLNLGYCNEFFTEHNVKPIEWISTFC